MSSLSNSPPHSPSNYTNNSSQMAQQGKKGKRNESKYLRKRNINEEILLEKSIHLIFFHYIKKLSQNLMFFFLLT